MTVPATDLAKAYKALKDKAAEYTLLWRYYDGDHPLVYSTARLREVFARIDARFVENWCAVVIDATMDRINLSGFQVTDNDVLTEALNQAFAKTELNLDSDDAHLAALVCGEAFVIVWKDEESSEIQAFYNDPRQCHVEYDPDNPRRKLWAAKWWVDAEEKYRLTLYYPDRLEYYVSTKKAESVSSASAFKPAERPTADNPFGVIPVFHLRRDRRKAQSELANAITPQDAVNKLLSDMMVAAEFGAFRQRYIIAQAEPPRLKNAPNEIWVIPGGDGDGQPTQVGEFEQTDISYYLTAIDKLATAIAIITRTPKHYFYQQGGDPSGDALIAMEAPLNKKCGRYIERFSSTWQKVAAFMAQLLGQEVEETDITPLFDRPETVQPAAQASIRQQSVSAGMPLATVLRDEGKDDAYLAQMEQDAQVARKVQQETLAAAMVSAQRQFDQGDADEDGA
jgi:hypothetical protein